MCRRYCEPDLSSNPRSAAHLRSLSNPNLIPHHSNPFQSPWISINPRPFSIPSLHEPSITNADAGEAASWDLGDGSEIDDPFAVIPADSSLAFGEDKTAVEGKILSTLWDETVEADDLASIFATEEPAPAESLKVDSKQVKKHYFSVPSDAKEVYKMMTEDMISHLSVLLYRAKN